VTINNLLPGAFDTERLRVTLEKSAAQAGRDLESVAAARRAGIPVGRFGAPAEFGALCAFLCSPLAGYINGQNLLIDGGAYPGTF
jgi:3-oxoacyl-[acyl-carrier protein] reductase